MKIYKSAIYDAFCCVASACPDSCCHEWSISVDSESVAMYRNLPGTLGDRLRQVLHEEDGDTVMTIENGRCPMWREDGLCHIQAELGHHALCKTCRDFPRLTHDYGDFQEWGLELSCPEAARLILNSPALPKIMTEMPCTITPEYDAQDMALLLQTREAALALLQQDRPIPHRLALLLMYGYHVQAELDGFTVSPFDPDSALDAAKCHATMGDRQAIVTFFRHLELLTTRWEERLATWKPTPWEERYAALARYFVDRYWLQAISDLDLTGRVKLVVISCLLIQTLGGNMLQTAQLYSKEIENDPDNVEALLDAAYTALAFTDDRLLGLLLEETQ